MAKNITATINGTTISGTGITAITYNGTALSVVDYNSSEYWRKSSDAITLTATGQPSYYNSSTESATYSAWRTASYTVPSGYTSLVVDSFVLAYTIGQAQTKLLKGTTELAAAQYYDYSKNSSTFEAGKSYAVTSGNTITFEFRAGRDDNRSSSSADVSATITFHFE